MTPKRFSVTGFLLLSALPFLPAQDAPDPVYLRFRHIEGEVYHADALVEESVYIDGIRSHDAEISESSLIRVLQADEDGGAELQAEFRTDEWIVGSPGYREWLSTETVLLHRSSLGRLEVPETAARPVLRNIPMFPEHAVKPGDAWTAPAEEVHVLRIGGALYGPYRGEILASYRYLDNRIADGLLLARILIEYDMYIPIRTPGEPLRLITGQSSQVLEWDLAAGRPLTKAEDFEFLMLMADGRTQEFRGRQNVAYRTVRRLDRPAVVRRLQNQLPDDGAIRVEAADDGVRLTLDDHARILFEPESAVLSSDQRRYLGRLADALDDFSERDILISGHTAAYGTPGGRRELSFRRAAAVADVLFPGGRSGPGKLYIRGRGAEAPVGTDAENRRVEILILD